MELQTSAVVEVCILAYLIAIVAEILIRRDAKRFLVQFAVLGAAAVLALLLNNATTGKVAFGGGLSTDRPFAAAGICRGD